MQGRRPLQSAKRPSAQAPQIRPPARPHAHPMRPRSPSRAACARASSRRRAMEPFGSSGALLLPAASALNLPLPLPSPSRALSAFALPARSACAPALRWRKSSPGRAPNPKATSARRLPPPGSASLWAFQSLFQLRLEPSFQPLFRASFRLPARHWNPLPAPQQGAKTARAQARRARRSRPAPSRGNRTARTKRRAPASS